MDSTSTDSGRFAWRPRLGRDTVRALLGKLLIVLAAAPATGQDDTESLKKFSFSYDYRQRIGEHGRFSGSIGFVELISSGLILDDWSRLELSGTYSHDLSRRLRLAGGLGLYNTFQPEIDNVFELRPYQQATLFWPDSPGKLRRWVFSHRFRLEQRFTYASDWSLAVRFRYRLASSIPINTHDLETGTFYVPLKVELFADVGEAAPEFFAETSSLSAGIGYVLSEQWTLDLRYTRQGSRDTVVDRFETTDHVIELSVQTTIRIEDLLKNL